MKNYKILNYDRYALGKYYLCPIQDKDIEKIRVWRNEQMDVLRQNSIITPEQQAQYYKNNVWSELNETNPRQILLSFQFDNRLIGYGGLVYIDWNSMVAEMSFLVETSRTKNIKKYQYDMKNFVSILISIAFDELNLKKITTETFNFRKETIEVLNNSNFKIDKNSNTKLGKKNSVFHSIINEK